MDYGKRARCQCCGETRQRKAVRLSPTYEGSVCDIRVYFCESCCQILTGKYPATKPCFCLDTESCPLCGGGDAR